MAARSSANDPKVSAQLDPQSQETLGERIYRLRHERDITLRALSRSAEISAPLDSVHIAALFVDPRGYYPELLGADHCWDAERDAMTYSGPWPVVAHPPCQLWVNLAAVNFKRYGGEHNRPGNDGGKFAFALAAVRRCGGVLEHPAGTKAWEEYDLARPPERGWGHVGDGEWVCEVWQSAYGHKARKRTWLFWKGRGHPTDGRLDRPAGTHQVGWFDRIKPTLSKREASASPRAFAEWLIELAQVSGIRDGSPCRY